MDCDEYRFIEHSRYLLPERNRGGGKNLADKKVFKSELEELVKKMWGSFAIFMRFAERCESVSLRMRRIFILDACIENSEFARHLEKIMDELSRYRDGAFDRVSLKPRDCNAL